MKRPLIFLGLLFLVLSATAFAFAQEALPAPTIDFALWATNQFAFAAAVAFGMAFAKENLSFLPLGGWRTIAGAFVLAVVGAVGLHLSGHIAVLTDALWHGVQSGALAVGGWAGIARLLRLRGTAPLASDSSTSTDAARLRARD